MLAKCGRVPLHVQGYKHAILTHIRLNSVWRQLALILASKSRAPPEFVLCGINCASTNEWLGLFQLAKGRNHVWLLRGDAVAAKHDYAWTSIITRNANTSRMALGQKQPAGTIHSARHHQIIPSSD